LPEWFVAALDFALGLRMARCSAYMLDISPPQSLVSGPPRAGFMWLKRNLDGSFTIFVQHDNPGPDREANWQPIPEGPFYLLLRA
jgi:hypothetical protein